MTSALSAAARPDDTRADDARADATAWPAPLIGQRLYVDFANSAGFARYTGEDPLTGWPALLAFLDDSAVPLPAAARKASPAAFRRAVALRDALHDLVRAVAAGRAAPAGAVAAINLAMTAGDGGERLTQGDDGWVLQRQPRRVNALAALLPIARSAAAALAEDDPARLRRCAHPECWLYFYDTSRNGSRRWCSMATCGNRVKVGAYHARQAG